MPVPFTLWQGSPTPGTTPETPEPPPVVVDPPSGQGGGVPPAPVTTMTVGSGFVPFCDRCGFVYKIGDLKKDWQGLLVCNPCFETRHPSDFMPTRPSEEPRSLDIKSEILSSSAGPTYIAPTIGVQS